MAVFKENEKRTVSGIKARMTLEYPMKDEVDKILKSVKVDNYNFIRCKRDKNRIKCDIESNSISSMLHTIDDFLSCIILAEEVYRSI